MSDDGGELGSGGFFGSSGGGGFGGLGGFGGMSGPGPMGLGPGGHFGLWPSCGCSTLFIILGIMLLLCGGCLRFGGQ